MSWGAERLNAAGFSVSCPQRPHVCALSYLRRGEAAVWVLLLSEPADDAGGVVQAKVWQGRTGEQSQEHVGRHLHLQSVQAVLRGPGSAPVTGAACQSQQGGNQSFSHSL